MLNKWNISDSVCGLCFDTTSSNTGLSNGACVILQELLGRSLLHLACRHHILELVAAAAFNEAMSVTLSPEIPLFKKSKEQWKKIDKTHFQDYSSDIEVFEALSDIRDDVVQELQTALSQQQPRDDYKELIEITLIFLGTHACRGVVWSTPGPMHLARWMSKVIYTFKVWMFRSQLKLAQRQLHGLRSLCIFYSRIYVVAWIRAPLAVGAPYNDLNLLKSLVDYKRVHKRISCKTSMKLAGQLWYLSEELVGLSLFDDRVSNDTKEKMVMAMLCTDGATVPSKRVNLLLDEVQTKSLEDFTTKMTMSLFTKLNLPSDFLHTPVCQWHDRDDYNLACNTVKTLQVTNDHAERGVALVQEFTGSLTKDEEQLQFLLQAVSDHRKRYPGCLKRNYCVDSSETE